MELDPQVLIVGAGPTGLTAAIELKRFGLDVRIVDKSDHAARFSQALVVQARTLEQFQRYGIAQEAVERGRKLTRALFWSEGKNIVTMDFSGIPGRYPYVLFLPQFQTEALLCQKLESLDVHIERQTELVSLDQHNNTVTAVLRKPDGTEETIHPGWVIGCDGAHSAVRELTHTPFEGSSVGLSFFLGDLELDGPDVPGDELSIHLHHGNVVFMGRLSDRIVRLIVALHGQQEGDIHRELTLQDFQNAIDQAGVRVTVRSAEWKTPFHVRASQAKHYRIGNVFLAGDASHIHSPVGGQGMNTGIQDVANLAWKISAVTRGANPSLLDSYEEERGEVGRNLLKSTERALKMATTANPVVEKLRDFFAPLVTAPESARHAIQGFISETAIEYRSSSVVADHGGDGSLHAGDRMPDISIGAGKTLLEDWNEPRSLAILLGMPDPENASLASVRTISLRPSDLDNEARQLIGSDPKILLLRPDGYIGYRGTASHRKELQKYIQDNALS